MASICFGHVFMKSFLKKKDHQWPNFIFNSKIAQLQTIKAFFFINKIKKNSPLHCSLSPLDCKNGEFFPLPKIVIEP
jgi:hypothetical protein